MMAYIKTFAFHAREHVVMMLLLIRACLSVDYDLISLQGCDATLNAVFIELGSDFRLELALSKPSFYIIEPQKSSSRNAQAQTIER